jgi:spore germination cell wall hydrolase CwlJ-like protein
MRKAKIAALIIGGVSTCIFGGTFGLIATSPIVKSVAPNNDVQNIYEVQSEELANVAAVTSIRTTPRTTTSKISYTAAASTVTISGMNGSSALKELPSISVSFNSAMAKPNKDNKTEGTAKPSTTVATVTTTEAAATTTTKVSAASTAATTTPTTATTVTTTTTAVPTTTVTTPIVTEITTTTVVTTTIATTTEAPTYTEPVTEAPTDAPVVEEIIPPADSTETVTPEVPEESVSLSITDEEYIILCNAVAHEAGCNWISTYDKALVVEVIMNRVESPLYPNTILGVLTQPYQFTGSSSYVYLGTYSHHVTQDVKDAVNLYFTETESFGHGYFGFYGDGYRNYFY